EDEEFESLKGLINTTGQFSKLILEIYALSRDDLKNVGQTLMQEKNYVVGVELQIDAHQAATAQRFLNALGAFIRYSIFVERFNEYTSLNLNESQILASRYDNYILSNRAVLEQLRQKRDSLQALYKKYPAFAKVDSRQVVDLEDNGERYLSLVTQIIGVESRIIDLERLLDSFGLERKRNLLYREFFSAVKKKLEAKPGSIEKLINSIHTLRAGFFRQPGDPLSQSLSNSLDIDINRFDILFNKTLRFISGPTLPDIPEWPRKSIFLIFGFFLGVLVFVSIALILEFWEKHKAFIRDGK
ncbi:MAG: hypothetical protein GY940_02525, partial [bacterium]|nr:hypothetical protein [bacterium]